MCIHLWYHLLELFCKTMFCWLLWYPLSFLFSNENIYSPAAKHGNGQPWTGMASAEQHLPHKVVPVSCSQPPGIDQHGVIMLHLAPATSNSLGIPQLQNLTSFPEASTEPVDNSTFPSMQTCCLFLSTIIILRINYSSKTYIEKWSNPGLGNAPNCHAM